MTLNHADTEHLFQLLDRVADSLESIAESLDFISHNTPELATHKGAQGGHDSDH